MRKIRRSMKLHTLRSGAKYLGIMPRTLRGVASSGLIPYAVMGNTDHPSSMIFDERDLDALNAKIDRPTRGWKPLFGNSLLAQAMQSR